MRTGQRRAPLAEQRRGPRAGGGPPRHSRRRAPAARTPTAAPAPAENGHAAGAMREYKRRTCIVLSAVYVIPRILRNAMAKQNNISKYEEVGRREEKPQRALSFCSGRRVRRPLS